MHIKHDLVFDHDESKTAVRLGEILAALGHGPNLRLGIFDNDPTVHGAVTVAWCDTRMFGEFIQFGDGEWEILDAANIERYFTSQGHKLVNIVGDKAFGNTIVEVELYDADSPPTQMILPKPDGKGFYSAHEGHFKKASNRPTAKTIKARLDAMVFGG